ncbi:MAG: CpaF family protein [Actinobacteria bacterium]|nr:CpaF family protein [Actinomycetota bacterium]
MSLSIFPNDRGRAPVSLDEYAVQLRERAIEQARVGDLRLEDGDASLRRHVRELVAGEAPALSVELRDELVDRVVTAAVGFGPLEELFADRAVDEIMVNGPDSVWVERDGVLAPTGVKFASATELGNVIERMIGPLGRRVDEASPICDARLPDGSRVNVVIPPLSLGGPVLTIRRFRHDRLGCDALVANGTMSERMLGLLAACVRQRRSLLVSGGTGSGKTTTLNALSSFIPAGERIVTIEDAAELRLRQGHVVRLEARPANVEGRGEVTIRALVRTALRMRPDRIVVGEVRGGEALDMLSALNTGHDGGLTTVHANSPAGALGRIETLALMAGVEIPYVAVRRMTGAALDLVVHQSRVEGGSRRIVSVAEVIENGDGYELHEVASVGPEGERWRHPRSSWLAKLTEWADCDD